MRDVREKKIKYKEKGEGNEESGREEETEKKKERRECVRKKERGKKKYKSPGLSGSMGLLG